MSEKTVSRKTLLGKPLRIFRECEHCDCDNYEIRVRKIANGTTQYVPQCLICGFAIGNPLKQSDFPNRPPEWDETLKKRWELKQQVKFQQEREQFKMQQAARVGDWWDEYNAYLRTPEWESRRRLVMLRSQGICEGCRKRTAKEVHHLSYAHVGQEFLFELVALCKECHDRWHALEDKRRAEAD